MPLARISLGANVGDRERAIEGAIERLGALGTVERRSALYASVPWGVRDQPEFLNAAVLLRTDIPPLELLRALQSIEGEFGRRPGPRWGPRTMDLDLLTYDDCRLDGPELTLPHPRLLERAFVLVPLAEIDGAFVPALTALTPEERAEVVPFGGGNPAGPCALGNRRCTAVQWDDVVRRVREVVATCVVNDLARIRVDEDGLKVEIRRRAGQRAPSSADVEAVPGTATPSANGEPDHAVLPALLRSDVVGVVHFSHPSVSVDSVLTEERELAYVESLGIRNPVSSGGPGRVVEIFVSEGQPVEYAQPLFAIERR